MTKREMLEEMLPQKGFDLENRMKNKRDTIQAVYEYFKTTEKTEKDKAFCMNVLTVW